MTQKTIKVFINEIFSKAPKKNYPTNKTDVYLIDEIWSSNILELNEYNPENNRGYRYVLVTINTFSKFDWTVPLKNKIAQTKTNSFENILIRSKREPSLFETDRGKKIRNIFFRNFSNNNNIKHYSRNTSVLAERFNRTIRDLLKRLVFLKRYGN